MNTQLLIDAIVRQTSVLIAHLSTASGARAPLAAVADQVFLQLSQQVEAKGVPRKVVADMFGLTLRGYQKKVQRISAHGVERERTLWQALLDHLSETGSATRHELFQRFDKDDPDAIAAVLNDLVGNGLVQRTGSGPRTLFSAQVPAVAARLEQVNPIELDREH